MVRFYLAVLMISFHTTSSRVAASNLHNDCNSPLGIRDRAVIKDKQLTASSTRSLFIMRLHDVRYTEAKYGRLGNRLAWCGYGPNPVTRPVEYLQVDFGEVLNVTAIATQGFVNGMDYYVTKYTLSFSLNKRIWFPYSKPNKMWSGNRNGNGVKKNVFDRPIQTRYLRIYNKEHDGYPCLRLEAYGCRPTKDVIAQSSTVGQPTMIATRPAATKVVVMTTVPTTATVVSVVTESTTIRSSPTTAAVTSTIRKTPTAKPRPQACDSPFGLEDGRIKDGQLSASSYVPSMYVSKLKRSYNTMAKYGRLNGSIAWCGLGPHKDVRPVSYFQVDFEKPVIITGLATQGLTRSMWLRPYYVKTFTLGFSVDGANWFNYSSPNKVWSGNKDGDTINRILFSKSIHARYLRIYPVQYNGRRCLRVEVYGCFSGNQTTGSTTSPNFHTPALLPSTRMTSPVTSPSQTPAIHGRQQHSTAEKYIPSSSDAVIPSTEESRLRPWITTKVLDKDVTPVPRSHDMAGHPSSSAAEGSIVDINYKTAKRHDSSFVESNKLLLLGICIGCGVLVVVTILVFMLLRTKMSRRSRITHRMADEWPLTVVSIPEARYNKKESV